jgi:hypothetical protein
MTLERFIKTVTFCQPKEENELSICLLQNEADDCRNCVSVKKLVGVFNPRTNQYETIYSVIEFQPNGEPRYWYSYIVYVVPIYEVKENGDLVIVGYKYYWNPIPELTAVEVGINGSTMIFD